MTHQFLTSLTALLLVIVTPFSETFIGVKGDVRKQRRAALIIIDVQDCFLPGGSLAVDGGEEVIPVINKIRRQHGDKFEMVALSKDWHPVGHVSFADSHPGKNPNDVIDLRYEQNGTLCRGDSVSSSNFPASQQCSSDGTTITLQQVMWPVHCVQDVSSGPTSSHLADSLNLEKDDIIINKGTLLELDSYSAFYDNGQFSQTNLDAILKSKGVNTVFVTGLALDYCVYYTSKDAHSLGYETYTVLDAARGVSKETIDKAVVDLLDKGVHLIQSDQIEDVLCFSVGRSSRLCGLPFALLVFLTQMSLKLLTV